MGRYTSGVAAYGGSQTRGFRPGHLAEMEIVRFLQQLPGVVTAEISSEWEDADKIDILLRLKGDYEPLKLQLTGNPRKSPKGLPEDICFIRFNLWEVLDKGISKSLGMKMVSRILSWLKNFQSETFEGLLAYWGI